MNTNMTNNCTRNDVIKTTVHPHKLQWHKPKVAVLALKFTEYSNKKNGGNDGGACTFCKS